MTIRTMSRISVVVALVFATGFATGGDPLRLPKDGGLPSKGDPGGWSPILTASLMSLTRRRTTPTPMPAWRTAAPCSGYTRWQTFSRRCEQQTSTWVGSMNMTAYRGECSRA